MSKKFFVFFSILSLILFMGALYGQVNKRSVNKSSNLINKIERNGNNLLTHNKEIVRIPKEIEEKIKELRARIRAEGFNYRVGYNPAVRYSLKELCTLTPPKNWNKIAQKASMLGQRRVEIMTTLPSSWDWRAHNGCTVVKNQGSCGGCWAFSTVGAFECAIKRVDGVETDLSEQYLISCNDKGYGCNGGWFLHDMHIDPGAVLESCFPYQASDVSCKSTCSHPYKLSSWSYVDPNSAIPSVEAIKSAIYQYGPVSAAIYATDAFQYYNGGVFDSSYNPPSDKPVNHAIMLVGWDDSKGAWILRNSWGTGWGENGYAYVKYGVLNVGYGANYVVYEGGGGNDDNNNNNNDAYEPNDSYGQAYGPIDSGKNYSGGEVSTSDDADWFYFEIKNTGTISVSVTINNSGADLDWYLYKDGNFSSYVARGYTTNNPESGTYNATSVGKYYLKVVGYNGSTSGYTLKVTYPDQAPPQNTDAYEPNDSYGQAYGPLTSGANYNKGEISTSSDADWFYFNIAGTGTISVSVTINDSGADLDWYLYKDGNLSSYVARGYTTNNPESGTYNATSTGKYYLKVVGYNGSTSGYTLKVTYPTQPNNDDDDNNGGSDTNIALGKYAAASSEYSSSYAASKAVDGSTSTGWASKYLPSEGTEQWIYIDLGATKTVSSVKIYWSTAGNYSTDYVVMRYDGSNWVSVKEVYGDGGWDVINFSTPIQTRYIGIYCKERNANYYYIREFQVYGH